MLDRITQSSVIPPRDHKLDQLSMSCRNSVNSGSDMVVLPMNSDSQDSFAYPGFPDSSNGVLLFKGEF